MDQIFELVLKDFKTSLIFAITCGPIHELEQRIDEVFNNFQLRLFNVIDDECARRAKVYIDNFKSIGGDP